LKTKLKGSHSNTTEVRKAEKQVELSTLTEHNFQDAFKKWQDALGMLVHTFGRGLH
jgi:hypothetical protein